VWEEVLWWRASAARTSFATNISPEASGSSNMPKTVPPVLKPLTPFIQRGEEMKKANTDASRVVCFFCLKYAMELGMGLNDKSPECKAFLMELMNDLESCKVKMDDATAKSTCEDFAMSVFARADEIDRAGHADKSTAQSFYAAATFFDLLKQFSASRELDEDIKQTQLYAKWKATEILRAVKEGRKPAPGGPGDHAPSQAAEEEPEQPPPPQAPPRNVQSSSPAAPAPPAPSPPPPPPVAYPVASAPAQLVVPRGQALSSLPKERRQDALEYIKFAKVAVEQDKVDLAISRLEAALKLLHAD
jgi:vacuolar protein sorting-associated protein VTA1